MKKNAKNNDYFLLHILENDRLMYLEATPEVYSDFVKDFWIDGYFTIEDKPIKSPIVKIFTIDAEGKEIDKSPAEVKQNWLNFVDVLLKKGIDKKDITVNRKRHDLIKVSLHSQLQKQGKKNLKQNSIFDIIENETDYKNKQELQVMKEEYKIEVVGLDLTKSQEKALFAIQTFLNDTDYKGNTKGKDINSEAMSFNGYLPAIKFSPTDYLELFGVIKKDYGRGYPEYGSNEREEALKALRDLSQNRFLMYYEKKYWVEKVKEYRYDVIRTIRPLINITEGFEHLNRKESSSLKDINSNTANDKLTVIAIEPNPILIDQIDTYFVLKPANCYQEIKILVGNASKFVYRFVDYLLTEVAQRNRKKVGMKDWNIKINYETLGTILRMDSYIKSRNWKKLRNSITSCYETAKKLGYLKDYKLDQEGKTKVIDMLILNPEKFQKIEEINKRRDEIEEQHKTKNLTI